MFWYYLKNKTAVKKESVELYSSSSDCMDTSMQSSWQQYGSGLLLLSSRMIFQFLIHLIDLELMVISYLSTKQIHLSKCFVVVVIVVVKISQSKGKVHGCNRYRGCCRIFPFHQNDTISSPFVHEYDVTTCEHKEQTLHCINTMLFSAFVPFGPIKPNAFD